MDAIDLLADEAARTATWSIQKTEGGEFFVVEKLFDHPVTQWGPIPSEGMAHQVVQERMDMMREMVANTIAALP